MVLTLQLGNLLSIESQRKAGCFSSRNLNYSVDCHTWLITSYFYTFFFFAIFKLMCQLQHMTILFFLTLWLLLLSGNKIKEREKYVCYMRHLDFVSTIQYLMSNSYSNRIDFFIVEVIFSKRLITILEIEFYYVCKT